MKKNLILVLVFIPLFSSVYAAKICEEKDLYELADPTCLIEYNKKEKGAKIGPTDVMFDIMKTYPYENKDKFERFLQKKIDIVKSPRAKRLLAAELEKVKAAKKENWEAARDHARETLKEVNKIIRKE